MRNIIYIVLISLSFITFLSFKTQSTHSFQPKRTTVKTFEKTPEIAPLLAADTLTWKLLGQIAYVNKKHPDYPQGVDFPIINPILKKQNKKPIIMSGFIVPIDNKSYALSKNVFAACFFCGKAGPETIMGIKFKNTTPRLKTDTYVTLSGTFRYNENDVNDWIYHIENAVIERQSK